MDLMQSTADAPEGHGKLIAFRADRLGGRLISLINSFRLAQTFDLPVVVHWRESDGLEDPTEIFDAEFVEKFFVGKEHFKTMRADGAPIASLMASPTVEAFRQEITARHAIIDPPFDILAMPFENPDDVKAHFIEIGQSLPLNTLLAQRVEEVRNSFGADIHSTAYHIRRGDLTADRRAMNKAWPNKFVPDEFFEAHMRANLGDASRVILFSDNASVLQRYKAMFPELLTFNDIAKSDGLTEPQRDALELMTMAMADQLIAPPSSAFSSTAKTIGGATFNDVESQLDSQARFDALDVLTGRLRDTPEVFANEGEIGQYLVYARNHLCEQGKGGEFARIAANHIRDGLNIAFIHAMTAREMYFDGQYQELCDLRKHIRRGFVVHSRSYAHLSFYHCLSLLMLGRTKLAIQQLSTAFWLEPTEGEINCLVGILEAQGELSRKNFWFSDPVVEQVFSNKFLLQFVRDFFQPLVDAKALTITRAVPNSRLKIWEWPYFANSDVGSQYRYKGHFRQTLTILKRHNWAGATEPNFNSFMGMLALREGDLEQSEELLTAAVKAQPSNALFQKRCAELFLAQEKYQPALRAIERACKLEPEAALFIAFKGLVQSRAGNYGAASKTFQNLLTQDKIAIPGIYFIAGEAMEAAKKPKEAIKAYASGLDLAPMDWKRQVALAKLEAEQGAVRSAIERLNWTLQWADERPPVVKTLTDLMAGDGDYIGAAAILNGVCVRYPNKPQFAKLRDKMIDKQARAEKRKAKKAQRQKAQS